MNAPKEKVKLFLMLIWSMFLKGIWDEPSNGLKRCSSSAGLIPTSTLFSHRNYIEIIEWLIRIVSSVNESFCFLSYPFVIHILYTIFFSSCRALLTGYTLTQNKTSTYFGHPVIIFGSWKIHLFLTHTHAHFSVDLVEEEVVFTWDRMSHRKKPNTQAGFTLMYL